MNDPGIIILDTNCYGHLMDQKRRESLLRTLDAFGWFIWPSAITVFEISKHSLPTKRQELLRTVHHVQRGRPLLPLPDEILRLTGEALLSGSELKIGESGYERFTEDPTAITPEQIAEIAQAMGGIDALHDEALNRGRSEIHKLYKQKNIQPSWSIAAEFLNEVWMTPSQLHDLIASECARLGLARALTYQEVMECEAWRLHFEAFGVALFRRVMGKQQEKVVQSWDLFQLVFLGGRTKRALVSNDVEFRRAATAVLDGRHLGSRVLGWEEFLEQMEVR